jgi:hypothetical protein
MKKVKEVKNMKAWAYIAPNGWVQVRSIGGTKKESREMIDRYDKPFTWEDLEKKGFHLEKIIIDIKSNK